MASYPASSSNPVSQTASAYEQGVTDAQIWDHLKQAIASSSGFHRWELESESDAEEGSSLDYRVRQYLRETLATLAY